jgi:hypothetical protein
MRKLLLGLLGLGVLACATFVFVFPVVQAYFCPSCLGFKRLAGQVFVEDAATTDDWSRLIGSIREGRSRVQKFYGPLKGDPRLLVCTTQECARMLGVARSRAMAYGASFIAISPRGINPTIIAHELAHIERRERLGLLGTFRDRTPAWFDEGLAVLISRDVRYLDFQGDLPHCIAEPSDDLPNSAKQWRRAAGDSHALYAQAACKVLRWTEGRPSNSALWQQVLMVATEGS